MPRILETAICYGIFLAYEAVTIGLLAVVFITAKILL